MNWFSHGSLLFRIGSIWFGLVLRYSLKMNNFWIISWSLILLAIPLEADFIGNDVKSNSLTKNQQKQGNLLFLMPKRTQCS